MKNKRSKSCPSSSSLPSFTLCALISLNPLIVLISLIQSHYPASFPLFTLIWRAAPHSAKSYLKCKIRSDQIR